MGSATRRSFLRHVTLAGAAAAATAASSRPARAVCATLEGPVRWIVPNAAGGGYDGFSRLLEPYLEKTLGVRIQVDNVAGAGGLRGATVLSEAVPDGTTLGIVNLPGLLMTAMTDTSTFHPLDELAMLGTIGRARHVWSAGGATQIRSAEQLLEAGRNRALVFGMNSFSSLGFLNAAIPCALLGLRAEFVSGYGGSSETMMAAIRGDVDLVSLSWDTQIDSVQSGDLRPLLRIAGAGPAEDELFEGLPALGGPKGLAAAKGPSVVEDADALVRFTGVGRVAAAPRGLPADLERCLAEAICASLSDPALVRAAAQARMGLEPACAAVTVEEARAVRADVGRLETIVREAIKRVRA